MNLPNAELKLLLLTWADWLLQVVLGCESMDREDTGGCMAVANIDIYNVFSR